MLIPPKYSRALIMTCVWNEGTPFFFSQNWKGISGTPLHVSSVCRLKQNSKNLYSHTLRYTVLLTNTHSSEGSFCTE